MNTINYVSFYLETFYTLSYLSKKKNKNFNVGIFSVYVKYIKSRVREKGGNLFLDFFGNIT